MDQRGVTDEAAPATAARAPRAGDGTRELGIVDLLLAARGVDERRGDDAGCAGRLGSLMRHFLSAGAITRLARGVMQPATTRGLVLPPGGLQGGLPCPAGARLGAIPIPAVAVAAEEEHATAVDARADDKPKRVQAPPRSGGRAGHSHRNMR